MDGTHRAASRQEVGARAAASVGLVEPETGEHQTGGDVQVRHVRGVLLLPGGAGASRNPSFDPRDFERRLYGFK